jgi:hypothetical protein
MGAPLGFKTFVTGDVLTAADTNGYLMQGVWTFASAAARDAAVTSPQEGNFCYLKDTNVTQYYTGSAWAALGASPQSYTLLSTTTLSGVGGTTATVSGLSGYNQFLVWIDAVSTTNTNPAYTVRLNGDSSSKYMTNAIRIQGTGIFGSEWYQTLNSQTAFNTAVGSGTAAATLSIQMVIQGANGSGVKPIQYTSQCSDAAAFIAEGQGIYTGTSVVSSFSLISSSGNFDAGTMYIYGAA